MSAISAFLLPGLLDVHGKVAFCPMRYSISLLKVSPTENLALVKLTLFTEEQLAFLCQRIDLRNQHLTEEVTDDRYGSRKG